MTTGPMKNELEKLEYLDSMEGIVRAEASTAPAGLRWLPRGDVVHAVYPAVGDEVRIDRQPVAAIGGGNPVAAAPSAHPIVLTHDARDFLVVDVHAQDRIVSLASGPMGCRSDQAFQRERARRMDSVSWRGDIAKRFPMELPARSPDRTYRIAGCALGFCGC